MEADRTELNNLAEKHSDKVKELTALYDAWAKRCNVLPWDKVPPVLSATANVVRSTRVTFVARP